MLLKTEQNVVIQNPNSRTPMAPVIARPLSLRDRGLSIIGKQKISFGVQRKAKASASPRSSISRVVFTFRELEICQHARLLGNPIAKRLVA